MTPSERWEVVGGSQQGGILARIGQALASPELPDRLATGSIIRQKELKGERLCYELVCGSGPRTGWVSLKVKGKDLVVPCQASEAARALATRPDWLRPSSARGRLLMLTVPWKGHMVHLKRIGLWFVGRPGYEVHFACFPEYEADLKSAGFNVHLCEGDETQAANFFLELEDGFRELAQAPESANKTMLSICQQTMADFADRDQDPLAAYFQFAFRIMHMVKPDVIIGDGFCSFHNLVPAWCAVENIQFIPVHSPGIPEDYKEVGDPAIASDLDPEKLAKAVGMPVEIVKMDLDRKAGKPIPDAATIPQGNPKHLTLLGAMISLMSLPPEMAGFMAGTLAKKLKVSAKTMSAVIKALPGVQIFAEIYPSTKSMVGETTTKNRSLFTSPLLPLAKPLKTIDGLDNVQRDRKSFEASLAPVASDLLDWMYDENEPGPIVYVAFGSIVRPAKDNLVNIAAALDGGQSWRVLWVLSESLEDMLPSPHPPRGRWRIERFVPQADLLKCNRVRCFLSHCGANSTTESLVCGVPLLCCPFYLDQFEWAKAVCEHLKAGLRIDKNADPSTIQAALKRLLQEPVFAENALRASRVMRSQADAVLELLGPEMAPPIESKLGPGASVCAAIILASLSNQSPDFIFDVVEQTAQAAERSSPWVA